MNFQQLEYIVAVDKYRHFVRAAQACGVTQSTLSSLIQRLEIELDIIIFDRNSHPVCPTPVGKKIIDQAKVVLYNARQLTEISLLEKEFDCGEIRLGIIPTVAPYILPQLFKRMREANPEIILRSFEMRTAFIVDKLQKAELDMAILATPLSSEDLLEIPLYYEKFIAYVSACEPIYGQKQIESGSMPTEHMWILQEGHCLRNQVFNFCKMKSDYTAVYEAGSIDTLVRIVDTNGGYTVIPELHIDMLAESQRAHLRELISPTPVREISLVIRKDYVRERLINIIARNVTSIIPDRMIDPRLKKFAIKL